MTLNYLGIMLEYVASSLNLSYSTLTGVQNYFGDFILKIGFFLFMVGNHRMTPPILDEVEERVRLSY